MQPDKKDKSPSAFWFRFYPLSIFSHLPYPCQETTANTKNLKENCAFPASHKPPGVGTITINP